MRSCCEDSPNLSGLIADLNVDCDRERACGYVEVEHRIADDAGHAFRASDDLDTVEADAVGWRVTEDGLLVRHSGVAFVDGFTEPRAEPEDDALRDLDGSRHGVRQHEVAVFEDQSPRAVFVSLDVDIGHGSTK